MVYYDIKKKTEIALCMGWYVCHGITNILWIELVVSHHKCVHSDFVQSTWLYRPLTLPTSDFNDVIYVTSTLRTSPILPVLTWLDQDIVISDQIVCHGVGQVRCRYSNACMCSYTWLICLSDHNLTCTIIGLGIFMSLSEYQWHRSKVKVNRYLHCDWWCPNPCFPVADHCQWCTCRSIEDGTDKTHEIWTKYLSKSVKSSPLLGMHVTPTPQSNSLKMSMFLYA